MGGSYQGLSAAMVDGLPLSFAAPGQFVRREYLWLGGGRGHGPRRNSYPPLGSSALGGQHLMAPSPGPIRTGSADRSGGTVTAAMQPVRQGVTFALDKALQVNGGIVDAYVARARRTRPDAVPAEIVVSLERQYLAAVTTLGMTSGAAATVPGVGTGVGLALNLAEVATFIEASAVFALAVAEVHGVRVDELERRRTLVVAVLLGKSGSAFVQKAAGRTGPYWGRSLVKAVPMTTIDAINRVLGPRFVTKYGTKQGVLVLGRELPFGMGAVIGGAGNAVLGRATIAGARRAFGPAPDAFGDTEPLLA